MISLPGQPGLHGRAGYGTESVAVAKQLGTNLATGLSAAEAARRLTADGPNELPEAKSINAPAVTRKQAIATLATILIVPVVVLATLGDYIDAVIILSFVAVMWFPDAIRARKLNAVRKGLAVPCVRVRRDGHLREISARDLVIGDIMMLEAGNVVAADGRLMDAEALRLQEAALTGDSGSVDKIPATSQGQVVGVGVAAGHHSSMVFMGTTVTHGCGHAVVTNIGMKTLIGKTVKMSQTVPHVPTAVGRGVDQWGRRLAFVTLALVCFTYVVGLVSSDVHALLTTASVAAAVVPEGLLAVVTIALALGGQLVLRKSVLSRPRELPRAPRHERLSY